MSEKQKKNRLITILLVSLLISPLVALISHQGYSYYKMIKNDEMIINTMAIDLKKNLDTYYKEKATYPKTLRDIEFTPVEGIFVEYQWLQTEFDLIIQSERYGLFINEMGIFDHKGKALKL